MTEESNITELLIRQKAVSASQVEKAKEEAAKTAVPIEKALERLGFISEEEIANIRATSMGVSYIDLEDYHIDSNIINLIPEEAARKYKAVPLFKTGDSLTVAMVNPHDIIALDRIRQLTEFESIESVLVTDKGLLKTLDSYYGLEGSMDEILDSLNSQKENSEESGLAVEKSQEAPVIKLVNFVIAQAAKERASDIHIEPEENTVRVRYRVDGVLRRVRELPKKTQNLVASRIKILAGMDIAESRKPQDGRIKMRLENKDLDLRVSTFPTVNGENITIRLLDKSSLLVGLDKLGFSENIKKKFENLIKRPHGIILVTGPTGSGKTTTLYSALTAINSMEKNIVTIEDPIEYELPLIRQSAVNPKAGLTFANGLRSILRQDPDVIMVGEIRDAETAEISIQAALTGHLVFSTLHTNDAASALARLIDMGVEAFLVSSSIIGILAQRLVRTLCEVCKEEYFPSGEILEGLGIKESEKFYRGKGCKKCDGSGLSGRIGVFELIVVDDKIREMVAQKQPAVAIKKQALSLGMQTLKEDGLRKARKGITSLDEVFRVTEIE